MKFNKKQQKRITACIILAVMGDSLSYMNGLSQLDSTKSKENAKIKTILYDQLVENFNKINLNGFVYSYNVNFLLLFPDKSRINDCPIDTETFLWSTRKISNLPKTSIKTMVKNKLFLNTKYIYRNQFLTKKEKDTLDQNNVVLHPVDTPILVGILAGIYLTPSKDSKFSPTWHPKIRLFKNHYTIFSIRVLAVLVHKLIYTEDLYKVILETNDYFVNNYTPINITEQEFIKKFDNYVKSTLYEDKVDIKKNTVYKKLNAFTTLIIAINAFFLYPNDIANLIKYSGIIYQRNPTSCAIACCFYGLIHGFHGVPSNLYTSIENYDGFIKNTINPFIK